MPADNPFPRNPFRCTLEQVRLAIEDCAPDSITFLGFHGRPPPKHQTLPWKINQYALFCGRRLSFCVTVYDDLHVGLHVRDADGREAPRSMPLHERSWEWVAKVLLCLEGGGVSTVRTDEPIVLRDNTGKHLLTCAWSKSHLCESAW